MELEFIDEEEYVDAHDDGPLIETRICSFCGHCEYPDACVWSIQCPECAALPSQQCHINGRVVPLHQQRHDYAERRRNERG